MAQDPDKKLVHKELMFVEEYIVDGNATRAAIAAGYSEKSAANLGARLIKKVHIQKAIMARREKRVAAIEVTEQWVIDRLAFVAAECSTIGPRWNPAGAARCAELIGRHKQMFTDKIIHGGHVQVDGEFRLTMQPGDDKL